MITIEKKTKNEEKKLALLLLFFPSIHGIPIYFVLFFQKMSRNLVVTLIIFFFSHLIML